MVLVKDPLKISRRFMKFAVVGGSGWLIQLGLTTFLTEGAKMPSWYLFWVKVPAYVVPLAIALFITTIWNFSWNYNWTFRQ